MTDERLVKINKSLSKRLRHDPEMLQGADQVLMMRDGHDTGWVKPEDVLRGPSKTVVV